MEDGGIDDLQICLQASLTEATTCETPIFWV